MKKEKNFWDKLVKVLYIGFILFICLIFMFMLFSIKGHCASDEYYFPMMQNENDIFNENVLNSINNYYNAENNYIFAYYDSAPFNWKKTYYVLYFSKTVAENNFVYGEIFNNAYQFSIYKNGDFVIHYDMVEIDNNGGNVSPYSASISAFQNLYSSSYNHNKSYVSNFQLMTNNSSSAKVVLFYDDGVTIPDGDTARDDMEKPDIDNYIPSWTNRPTFDGSTVENALLSIWDITIWTAENTRDTIKGVGQFIGDTLRWTSQKIIDSIRSKIDEIKTGIVNAINGVSAFVQDIKGFVSYVAEPLDVSSVQSNITGSTAFGDVSTITGAFADFKGVFDNTSEPSEYKIPFHLESISILNQTQTQYIDLSVIANQRGLIRAFCWVVTTFSLFVTVVDALPNYLKGGDE